MKNIHKIKENIYITSDEEIKEGDWFISLYSNSIQRELKLDWTLNKDAYKKIILTTDQDLIKDGVQAIDDEFLEWFVKNPSCEEIEIEQEKSIGYAGDRQRTFYGKYKIIIPKEEPTAYHYLSCCRSIEECHCGKYPKQELERGITITHVNKQERLEEAAENYGNSIGNKNGTAQFDFIRGAKWQQERMYSEADKIMEFLDNETKLGFSDGKTIERIKWYFETYFEQFKKK